MSKYDNRASQQEHMVALTLKGESHDVPPLEIAPEETIGTSGSVTAGNPRRSSSSTRLRSGAIPVPTLGSLFSPSSSDHFPPPDPVPSTPLSRITPRILSQLPSITGRRRRDLMAFERRPGTPCPTPIDTPMDSEVVSLAGDVEEAKHGPEKHEEEQEQSVSRRDGEEDVHRFTVRSGPDGEGLEKGTQDLGQKYPVVPDAGLTTDVESPASPIPPVTSRTVRRDDEKHDSRTSPSPLPTTTGPIDKRRRNEKFTHITRGFGMGNKVAMRSLRKRIKFRPNVVLQNSGSVARDHLANERTFLAYVRTSLAIASAGVVLVQLFTLSKGIADNTISPHLSQFARPLGATLIITGFLVLMIGLYRYFSVQELLPQGKFLVARMSTAFISFVISVVTVTTFVALLVNGARGQ